MSTLQRDERAHAYENPREDVQALVPRTARRILDLGCSSGALGAALKRRDPGVEVVGVELDPGYARDAQERLDRAVCADVAELAARDDLAEELGRFDCVVAADVLEHLVDPWTTMRRYAELLAPGGTAVVSVPNVRYWETFWQLGRHGRWPRRPVGIFDATHLRWFTLKDLHQLLYDAGLELETVTRQMRLHPDGSRWDATVQRLEWIRPLRPWLTFQHVVAARRPGGP